MNLYMDISTFDSLKNKGKIIVSIINKILDGCLFPINFELKVLLEKFDEKFLRYKLNNKNWLKVCDMLISGEVRHIMISYAIDEFTQPNLSISCTTDLAYEDALYKDRKTANNFVVSINLNSFNGEIPILIQSNTKKIYTETFKALNGIVGYINIASGHASLYPSPSEYECLLRHISTDYLAENFDQRCRGYHWSNILTEGHINKLGGISLIKEKSPCFLNEEFIMDNGSKALFMQLTEDINYVSDQEFIRLKEYLEPILPLVNQY